MKVALVQINAGTDKQDNLQKVIRFISQAANKKAELILLPEVFLYRGPINRQNYKDIVEPLAGPTLRLLKDLAKDLKVHLLAGSLYEEKKGTRKAYNTSVLLNPRGEQLAFYRKRNLFDVKLKNKSIQESKTFEAGKRSAMASVNKFTLGLSICFDLRFPALYSEYSQKGTNVLCVPSSFTHETGKAHWEPLLRARAIENLSYVLAPNQVGLDGHGVRSHGHSMIVDPWGQVIACASSHEEEIVYAKLDLALVKKLRRAMPVIK